MNWGWSGYYDGFFELDALNPGTASFNSDYGSFDWYQTGFS